MDVLPTIVEATGAKYPKELNGKVITPIEGVSLLPLLQGQKLAPRAIGFDHQAAHAWRDGDWKAVYAKRMTHQLKWELYNLAEDRCELNDLAGTHPERLKAMVADWEKWANRVGVTWEPYETTVAGTAVDKTPAASTEPNDKRR